LAYSAKECAFIAVFVATVIAAQLALSALPGVEVVTALFVSYSFAFGVRRGCVAAIVFSLLRQLLFGFFPTVLIVYLIYYTILTAVFGLLGKRVKNLLKYLWLIVMVACICSVCFTTFDNIITPYFLGYGEKAWQLYVYASLPVMGVQVATVAVTVGLLFLPLQRAFALIARISHVKARKE
jgi:hypothetical protein